jgi:D-alanine-D-alanine ligase
MSELRRREVVGVFFGGVSPEHAVSRASAASVVRHLDPHRYDVLAIGIAKDGSWHQLSPADVRAARERPAPVSGSGSGAGSAMDDQLPVRGPEVGTEILRRLTVAFPVLHGATGENGSLQGLFEVFGLAYVGAGVLASATAMDKVATKRALLAAGLDVLPYTVITDADWPDHQGRLESFGQLRAPWFVKPAGLGSSIGITRVTDPAQLAAAVELALKHDSSALVEEGMDGARELECGVLGGFSPQASAVGEVRVDGGWFDFTQKYLSADDPMTVPAEIPDHLAARVRDAAELAFRAIGGWGLARVDFLYDETTNRLVVNELNTMPGFTAYSMYPKVWRARGLAYGDLLDRLVLLALERQVRAARRAAHLASVSTTLAGAR